MQVVVGGKIHFVIAQDFLGPKTKTLEFLKKMTFASKLLSLRGKLVLRLESSEHPSYLSFFLLFKI